MTGTEMLKDRYASEVDVDFVRKAVRSIGRLAIKIASSSDQCITTLLTLMQTKISYVVQEAIVVIKDIFRRYPNQYESIIGTLCENLDALDEPEAKAAMIWIVGQYADRIENSDELLEDFMFTFKEEPAEVSRTAFTLFSAHTAGSTGSPHSDRQTIHQKANSSTGTSTKGLETRDRRGGEPRSA
jgi:vesicle coat complex subunit